MDRILDAERLFEHVAWSRRLAASLAQDQDAAEDLAQDAWAAAAEHDLKESALRNWLAAVMARIVRKRRREGARRKARETIAAHPEAIEPAVSIVERAELHETLVRAVLDLDEPLRATLLLRYFDGMMPARIAAVRGEPLATVKTHLARGLQRLRDRFDREHRGGRDGWASSFLAFSIRRDPAPFLPGIHVGMIETASWILAVAILVAWILTAVSSEPTSADGSASPASAARDRLVAAEDQDVASRRTVVPVSSSAEAPAPLEPGVLAAVGSPEGISGTIVDELDRPIAGAEVLWRPIEFEHAVSTTMRDELDDGSVVRAKTDEAGSFRLDPGPGAERGEVRASAKGRESRAVVRPSSPSRHRIRLPLATRRIAGIVIDRSSRLPIEGATVLLVGSSVIEPAPASRFTGPDGTFEFDGAPEACDVLIAGASRHEHLELGLLAGADAVGIELLLDSVPVLRGRVVDRESGQPIRGAIVADPYRSSITDEAGEFEFADLTGPRRMLAVSVRAPGYATRGEPIGSRDPIPVIALARATRFALRVARPRQGAAISAELTHEARLLPPRFRRASVLELGADEILVWADGFDPRAVVPCKVMCHGFETLRTVAAAWDGELASSDLLPRVELRPGWTVTGHARSDDAREMPQQAEVLLLARDGTGTLELRLSSAASRSPVDGDGRWRFDGLGAGAWDVCVLSRAHEPAIVPLELDDPPRRIELEVVLRSRPLRSTPVRGRVLDEDGRPLANASVHATDGALGWSTRTDATGAFALLDLPLAPLRVSARAVLESVPKSASIDLGAVEAGDALLMTARRTLPPPGTDR